MVLFHTLETSNPCPKVMALRADFQADGGKLTVTLGAQGGGHWLSILDGKLRFWVRGGQLTLQGEGGNFQLLSGLPNQQQFLGSWELFFVDENAPTQTIKAQWLAPEDFSQLQASFVVTIQNLAIAETQGLWPPDLSPNQLTIVDRLLAKFLAETYFSPALCWGQWLITNSQSQPPWQSLSPGVDPQTIQEKTSHLGARLQSVINEPSSDCLTLAQTGELDPQRDLAGGKFLGANLNGIDLSNAQLGDSNFRGAILTDADLSNADLSRSRFRGADLSGAYLEGATLTQADFRKSSLALANLIGADLRGADLREATLQNVNFSGAKVENAHFGDNPGLTPTQQSWLLENGAKLTTELAGEMLG